MEMIKSYNNQELMELFQNKVDCIDIDGYAEDFLNCYKSGCINDAIIDYANGLCDIYNHDLLQWASNNINLVDDYFDCCGKIEVSSVQDICNIISSSQSMEFEDLTKNNIIDIIEIYAYNYVINKLSNIDDIVITEEQIDEFLTSLRAIDEYNYFEDIDELCENFLIGGDEDKTTNN